MHTLRKLSHSKLVDVFGAGEGKAWGCKATTEGERDKAIEEAKGRDGLCFIEVTIDRDDCNVNLLRWGNHVARNNGRPNRCK